MGQSPCIFFWFVDLAQNMHSARNMHSSYSVSSGGQPDTSRPRCSRKPASINLIPSSDLRQRAGHVAAPEPELYCRRLLSGKPHEGSVLVTGGGFHLPVRASDLGA